MAMRKFLDDAEVRSRQGICSSQGTKKETGEGDAECKEEDPVEDEGIRRRTQQSRVSCNKIVEEGLQAEISFRLRLRRRYFALSEFYSMGLKNNGIIRCSKKVWIARVKPKNLYGTLLFEQWKCRHR